MPLTQGGDPYVCSYNPAKPYMPVDSPRERPRPRRTSTTPYEGKHLHRSHGVENSQVEEGLGFRDLGFADLGFRVFPKLWVCVLRLEYGS